MTDRLAQLETMAIMQDAHNREVHPAWREQGYPYYRAIWVECAELLDHFGWKWWKLQRADIDQARLELVDIWHFGLSDLLRSGAELPELAVALGAVDDAAAEGLANPTLELAAERFRQAVEQLAAAAVAEQRFAMSAFVDAMRALPMTLDELFALYVGKNVLNTFRQRNGYQTGAYQKLWGGREDNEHLVEALAELDCLPSDVPTLLSVELDRRYRASLSR